MDKLVNSIAIITRTPKHYFESSGANISGDALIVMESPLIKKVTQLQEMLSLGWTNVADFFLRQSSDKAVKKSDISTIWGPLETMQPTAASQEIKALVDAGIPLETVLRRQGWGKDEIDQMYSDMEEAKKRSTSLGKVVLDAARTKAEQDNNF
jgi:hypothetical protein